MPRRYPPRFTPKEDAILLATAGEPAEVVNRQLAEAGFIERTANAIKSRRLYLHRLTDGGSVEYSPDTDPEGRVSQLIAERKLIQGRVDSLNAEMERTRDKLREVEYNLRDAMKKMTDDLEVQIEEDLNG